MTKELPPSSAPSSEKWYDGLRVRVGDRRRAAEIRREIAGAPPPEVFGVVGVEPDGFESRVIAASAAALTSWLEQAGFAGRPVAAGRVHLLTPEEYHAKIGRDGPDGLTMYGHAYIRRTTDRVRLIHMVTHEMVHQAAFLALRADRVREPDTGDTVTRSHADRGGLVTFRGGDPLRPQFQGLNEGTTELIAHEVRREFLGRFGPLETSEMDKVLCFWAYSGWCLLTAKLLRAAAGDAPDSGGSQRLLYRDYFLGTSDFLKTLENAVPGARSALRQADVTVADALAVARKLGLTAVADRLEAMRRRTSAAR